MSQTKTSLASIKILKTVYDLNNIKHYPSSSGVSYILNGHINEETLALKELATFSSLLSLKGRKLTSQITQLVRHGYLKNFYAKKSFKRYLEITPKGVVLLLKEESERKIIYKKQTIKKDLDIYIKQ